MINFVCKMSLITMTETWCSGSSMMKDLWRRSCPRRRTPGFCWEISSWKRLKRCNDNKQYLACPRNWWFRDKMKVARLRKMLQRRHHMSKLKGFPSISSFLPLRSPRDRPCRKSRRNMKTSPFLTIKPNGSRSTAILSKPLALWHTGKSNPKKTKPTSKASWAN